jgi:hypothetical protein
MSEPPIASQAQHADQAMRTFLLADGRTGLNPREAITALLTSLRHYADRLDTDFGDALSTSSSDYARQRQQEEHAYTAGQEIRLRTRQVLTPSLASLPARGVVEALYPRYPGGSGTQLYAIRFPGEVSALPFTGDEIEPAPAFPHLRTSRGIVVTSLAQAEKLLTEAVRRIREQQMRILPPGQADISDRHTLSAVLDEICDLAPGDILTQIEHQAAARTDGFHAMAAASELGRRHRSAGIQPFGSLEQHGDGEAHLMSVLGETGPATDGNRTHRAAIVAAYRDAYDSAQAQDQRSSAAEALPVHSPARLAASDFPGHRSGQAVTPAGSGIAAAASSPQTAPAAEHRPGQRRHPR